MTTPATPDPNTVSHEAVALVARSRATGLFEDVLMRDAKIKEQQQYIEHMEARVRELEAATGSPRPMPPTEDVRAPAKG
jgi:hypothetical protein